LFIKYLKDIVYQIIDTDNDVIINNYLEDFRILNDKITKIDSTYESRKRYVLECILSALDTTLFNDSAARSAYQYCLSAMVDGKMF